MNKLKLDLETVKVLSFPTTSAPASAVQAGTVFGVSLCGVTCQGTSVCCETV